MELANYKTINNSQAHVKTSDRYLHIPTSRALEVFQDNGWYPTTVVEMRARKKENLGFQKHAVRFRHKDYAIADVGFPEIVLSNSHMGTSAFKLQLGVFRIVCSNGCIAGDIYKMASIRHLGYQDEHIYNSIIDITQDVPKLTADINLMREITLNTTQQIEYAAAVASLTDTEEVTTLPTQLLRGRREADGYSHLQNRSLFQTFNVIQENVIKGGVRKTRANGTSLRAKAITGLDANLKLNTTIWKMANAIKEQWNN